MKSFLRSIQQAIASFFDKFKKPYRSSTLSLRGLLHSLTVAVIVFVFLYVLKPFGLIELNEADSNLIISVCGLITLAAMLLCNFVFPLIARSYYDEHHWTGGKQLTQSLIMSFLISLGLNYYLNVQKLERVDFPILGLGLFAISVIPLVLFVYIQETLHANKFSRKAEDLNSELNSKGVLSGENPLKILVFRGSNEKLSLIPNQLIYAKIGDNTSEFYYQNPFGIDKSVMNISAKEVREELTPHPQFSKFSKDLIINKNAIQSITGTARGYDIAIAKVNEMVKVSNKYRKNLENI